MAKRKSRDPLACKWCKLKTRNGEPALPLEFEGVHVGVGHRICLETALLDGVEASIRASLEEEYAGQIIIDPKGIEEGNSIQHGGVTWYFTKTDPKEKKA